MNNLIMILDATAKGAVDPKQQMIQSVGLLVICFALFYFLLIAPQRKKDKELKEQLSSLRVGDKVITIGGLVGLVANIKDDEVTISTSAANTLVTFTKSAIQTVIKREDANKKPEEKKAEAKKWPWQKSKEE